MGLHHCTDVHPEFDKVHKGYDYYGPDVNATARIQSVAAGGQITMSVGTYEVLCGDQDYQDLVAEDCVVQRVSNGVELKGMEEKVPLCSIAPAAFATRAFPPIEGYEVDGAVAALGSSHASSIGSMSAASESGTDVTRLVVEHIFASLPDSKQRKAFLAAACDANAVRPAAYAMRLKLLARAAERQVAQKQSRMMISDSMIRTPNLMGGGKSFRSKNLSQSQGSAALPGVPEGSGTVSSQDTLTCDSTWNAAAEHSNADGRRPSNSADRRPSDGTDRRPSNSDQGGTQPASPTD
jgi:hypothetical protein